MALVGETGQGQSAGPLRVRSLARNPGSGPAEAVMTMLDALPTVYVSCWRSKAPALRTACRCGRGGRTDAWYGPKRRHGELLQGAIEVRHHATCTAAADGVPFMMATVPPKLLRVMNEATAARRPLRSMAVLQIGLAELPGTIGTTRVAAAHLEEGLERLCLRIFPESVTSSVATRATQLGAPAVVGRCDRQSGKAAYWQTSSRLDG
jgi:hypothetical protein